MANDKKTALLGINYSTANSALRKMIIFHLAGKLDILDCHQPVCLKKYRTIDDIEDFSIEHKDSWMQAEDPRAAFFDMENIAFSHLSCNSANADRSFQTGKTECPYGHEYTEENTYVNNKGWRRCKTCRKLNEQ